MKLHAGNHELELIKRPKRSFGRATLDTLVGAAEIAVGTGLVYGLAKNYREIMDSMHYAEPVELGTMAAGFASPLAIAADGVRRMANYDWQYRRHPAERPSYAPAY